MEKARPISAYRPEYRRNGCLEPGLEAVIVAHHLAKAAGGVSREWGMTPLKVRSVRSIAGWGNRDAMGVADDARRLSTDLVEICRPEDLGDIANLGLTLPEGSRLT